MPGSDPQGAPLRWLRAGPLEVALDGVDLRYVRLGDEELARRVYVGVRDQNWNTIPGVASTVQIDAEPDSFSVRFSVRHAQHDIDFSWEGHIAGSAEGHILYEMHGSAARPLLYNRIGFCVLHPWRESAGRSFRATTPDGVVAGVLPSLIGVQGYANGVYVPLVPPHAALELDAAAATGVRFDYDGDLFESEDQRNWGDASFKSYCTPLALGFPHELGPGQTLSQAVRLRALGAPTRAHGRAEPRVGVGEPTGRRVPAVGLGLREPGLSEQEAALVRALAPAHLRVELQLDDQRWRAQLQEALAASRALEAALELALFVRASSGEALAALRDDLAAARVARVLVAPTGARTVTSEETTPPELVRQVRDALRLDGIPIAGGTDMYFCELNRTRPQTEAMDGLFWSVNAQVHAFDDISLLETPEALGEQVRAASAFADGLPLFVSPVTLKRRYNVNETVAAPLEIGAELPDPVDARQPSRLAAAWTLASAKHLSEQGAAAITFYETTGWRGVIQGDAPPPLEAFPARAGEVFPLYHVLSDLCALRGGELLTVELSTPLAVSALAVHHGATTTLLLASLSPTRLSVALEGLGAAGSVRRLNRSSAESAAFAAGRFRTDTRQTELGGRFELEPYETVRIDVER